MLPDWLNLNAPGYDGLSQEEKGAIMYFSLLWSLFEGQVLNTSASARSIEEKANEWREKGQIIDGEFDQFKEYFVERYIDDDQLNYRFEKLHLRNGDKPELVKSVLLGKETEAVNVVTAILIIVLRYRNNFFHGIKWAYQFAEQLGNFNMANQLLMKVIEKNRNG